MHWSARSQTVGIYARDVYIRDRAGSAILGHDPYRKDMRKTFWASPDSVGFIYSCSNVVNDPHVRLNGISSVFFPAWSVQAATTGYDWSCPNTLYSRIIAL